MENHTNALPEAAELPPVADPQRTRPSVPEGYGLPETDAGLLSWVQVEERLVGALHYWLATVRPDGTPHVVPRWGVWVAGRFGYLRGADHPGTPATCAPTRTAASTWRAARRW